MALSAEQVRVLSARIHGHLVGHQAWRSSRVLLGYASFRQEVDTFPLLAEALAEGKELVLPRVDPRARRLNLLRVRDLAADLEPGYQGIPEPRPGRCAPADPGAIDLVLVPGLVFDRRGFRLGYGGGYYDRLLPSLSGALRVGLAFSLQVVDELPVLAHDLPVDVLVTEEGILEAAKERAAQGIPGARGDRVPPGNADERW